MKDGYLLFSLLTFLTISGKCLANTKGENENRYLQQTYSDCPDVQCLQFDDYHNKCVKCREEKNMRNLRGDALNNDCAYGYSDVCSKNIAMIIGYSNIALIIIVHQFWAYSSRQNKQNFTHLNYKQNQLEMPQNSPQFVQNYPVPIQPVQGVIRPGIPVQRANLTGKIRSDTMTASAVPLKQENQSIFDSQTSKLNGDKQTIQVEQIASTPEDQYVKQQIAQQGGNQLLINYQTQQPQTKQQPQQQLFQQVPENEQFYQNIMQQNGQGQYYSQQHYQQGIYQDQQYFNQQMNIQNQFQGYQPHPNLPQQQLLQASNQISNKKYTVDVNAYCLTQAGIFSFLYFDNMNRIKHVMINFIILERIFSYMIDVITGEESGSDYSFVEDYLILVFILTMVYYWLYTFIPPIIIRLFACCWCLNTNPNGRCSNAFLTFLYYLAGTYLLTIHTISVTNMSVFYAQLWIILTMSGFLVVIFFDKKSIEFAKSNKGGCIEKLIKFRKIDFDIYPQQLPQQNEQIRN